MADLIRAKEIINHQGMPALFAEVYYERAGHGPTCPRDDECMCTGDYPESVTIRGCFASCVLQDHADCTAFLGERAFHFPRRSFMRNPEDGHIAIEDGPMCVLREIYPSQTLEEYARQSEPFHSPWLTTARVLKLAERPVPWLWEPYLAPGALTVLYADSDAGKSTLICNLLTRMLIGEPDFLDLPISPAFVLYLTEDPPIALKWRTESPPFAGLRNSDHVRWFRQGTVVPGTDKGGQAVPVRVTEWDSEDGPSYKSQLYGALKQHRESALAHLPILIVIDTITTFLGFEDGNSSPEVAKVMRDLGFLADTTGAAVLALHHARRPRDGAYRVNYLGSAQFKAQCEIFLALQRQAYGRGNRQRSLELDKTRLSEHKEPLSLVLTEEKAYEIDPDPPKGKSAAGDEEKEAHYREIWEAKRNFPDESNRALAKMLTIDEATVRRALKYAKEWGWAAPQADGLQAGDGGVVEP